MYRARRALYNLPFYRRLILYSALWALYSAHPPVGRRGNIAPEGRLYCLFSYRSVYCKAAEGRYKVTSLYRRGRVVRALRALIIFPFYSGRMEG